MTEERHTEALPSTATSGVGPSAAQPQAEASTSAAAAPPVQPVLRTAAPTEPLTYASVQQPASGHAPIPQGHEQNPFDYVPIAAPPRAASAGSHPNSFRGPATTEPMRHTIASLEDAATLSGYAQPRLHSQQGQHPLPPLPIPGHANGRRPGIDWIVPIEEQPYREKSVGERLLPTLEVAIVERDKYAMKARMTGYALNAAIGLQVLLGSLTTALSAATTGKSTQIATVTLGGLATLVASYLARARGSNEPELSITRVKDLEQFIRECQAFRLDHGHVLGDKYDHQLEIFRRRFEELLGNANGERKLSPPV